MLNDLNKNELIVWLEDVAKLWLAHDGLWFQSIEKKYDIDEAIEHDKNAWERFSPLEAKRIKKRLKLPEKAGLEGLKKALQHRIYALLNKQEVIDEKENSFVFRMNKCRVQSARKKRGLADFPCKKVGIVEYSTFASEIDDRIETKCICCPPDDHSNKYYCAWLFTLELKNSR